MPGVLSILCPAGSSVVRVTEDFSGDHRRFTFRRSRHVHTWPLFVEKLWSTVRHPFLVPASLDVCCCLLMHTVFVCVCATPYILYNLGKSVKSFWPFKNKQKRERDRQRKSLATGHHKAIRTIIQMCHKEHPLYHNGMCIVYYNMFLLCRLYRRIHTSCQLQAQAAKFNFNWVTFFVCAKCVKHYLNIKTYSNEVIIQLKGDCFVIGRSVGNIEFFSE